MFIYVVAAFLSILLGNIGLMNMGEWTSLKGFIYAEWLSPVFGDYLGSLVFALCFVIVNWFIGHILYKKKFILSCSAPTQSPLEGMKSVFTISHINYCRFLFPLRGKELKP